MTFRSKLFVIFCLSWQSLAASIHEHVSADQLAPAALVERNFDVAADDKQQVIDDGERAITYSYLNYGGYPYLSLTKTSGYDIGFNSTQAGLVSLLGNAALALGGLFVLGKSKFLVDTARPFNGYRPRPSNLSNKFRKRRGPFSLRKKKKKAQRPRRPHRNYMSRHSPISLAPAKVLEPVKPMMLDDVAFDSNYDDFNYDDVDFNIGNNNLIQRKGPHGYDKTSVNPNFIPELSVPVRKRPLLMVTPEENGMKQFVPAGTKPRPSHVEKYPEEEYDTYFENEYAIDTSKKNSEFSEIDSMISLSPDGKRLRRKIRRTTTTTRPTTTSTSTTTTTKTTTRRTPPTYTTRPPRTTSEATTKFSENIGGFFGGDKPTNSKDEFDKYWSGDFGMGSGSFMDKFGPQSFSETPAPVRRLVIEEKFPMSEKPRVLRKSYRPNPKTRVRTGVSLPEKFDPFEDMAKEFDVDNDELIANISKAFDEFSDFKKLDH